MFLHFWEYKFFEKKFGEFVYVDVGTLLITSMHIHMLCKYRKKTSKTHDSSVAGNKEILGN